MSVSRHRPRPVTGDMWGVSLVIQLRRRLAAWWKRLTGLQRVGLALLLLAGSLPVAGPQLALAFAHAQVLKGVTPVVTEIGDPVGPTSQKSLTLTLALRPDDEAGLLADAASKHPRRLSPSELADRYAISTDQEHHMMDWLAAQGLYTTRTYHTRLALQVTGSVLDIERLFHVPINDYRSDHHVYYANNGDPLLTGPLAGHVTGIFGLTNFGQVFPANHVTLTPALHPASRPAGPPRRNLATAPMTTTTTYQPSDITAAYDVNALYSAGITGTGETIAIATFGTYTPTDLSTFWSQTGITRNLPSNVSVDGGSASPNLETALDLEYAGAIAPGANLLAYIGNQSTTQGLYDDFSQIVSDNTHNTIDEISTSYGVCELNWGATLAQSTSMVLASAVIEGIAVFAASGDYGTYGKCSNVFYTANNAVYPASDPSVTSVGGTSLMVDGSGHYASEVVWNDCATAPPCPNSGGAPSQYFSQPAWEHGTGVPANGKRDEADVALHASKTPYPYLLYYNGQAGQGYGTSFAAPEWAGMEALLDAYAKQQGYGPLSLPVAAMINDVANSPAGATALHDVTSGHNDTYSAGVGWDYPTGWGSPDLMALAQAIVAVVPTRTPQPPTATPTNTPIPTLSASRGSGPTGTVLLVNGSHWTIGDKVNLSWGSNVTGLLFSQATVGGLTGTFQSSFSVPGGPGGASQIIANSSPHGQADSVPFAIIGTASVSPVSAAAGTRVAVSGLGFTPGETVDIAWDSPGNTLARGVADAGGHIGDLSIRVPAGVPGAHTVYLTGEQSGTQGTATLTLTAQVFVQPIAQAPGGSIVVSGTGYTANGNYTINWLAPGFHKTPQPIATVIADSQGTLGQVSTALPVTATLGAGSIQVALTSASTKVLATTKCTTFSGLAPQLLLQASWGHEETLADVAGVGFLPNSSITLTWQTGAKTFADGVLSTDANGAVQATGWADPAVPYGNYTVIATQPTTTTKASTIYSVLVSVVARTTVSQVEFGQSHTLALAGATGFRPGEAVTFSGPTGTLASVTADTLGNVPDALPFTIPAVPTTTYHVTVTGQSSLKPLVLGISVKAMKTALAVKFGTSGASGIALLGAATGFLPGEPVDLSLTVNSATAWVSTYFTDGRGQSLNRWVGLPPGLTTGTVVTVSAAGELSGGSATANYTVP